MDALKPQERGEDAQTLTYLGSSALPTVSSSSEVFLPPLPRPSGIAENCSQERTQYSDSELDEEKCLDPKSEIVAE